MPGVAGHRRSCGALVPWLEVALGVWLLLATGPALVVVAVLTLLLFVAYLALVVVAVRGPEPVGLRLLRRHR